MNIFETARSLELPPTHVADTAWDLALKRRNHRRVRRAAAGVVLTGIATVVYLSAVATPDRLGTSSTSPDLTCPHRTSSLDLPMPETATLPQGATAAVLCRANGADWRPPGDPLEQDLNHLVDLINTRPDQGGDGGRLLSCIGDHPVTDYSITFTYPDGSKLAVWGDPCSDLLRTGGQPKLEAGLVLRTYLESLVEQRATRTPPQPSSSAQCPDREGGLSLSLLPLGKDLELQQATTCRYRWTQVSPGAYAFVLDTSSPLDAAQVEWLNTEFAAKARPIDADYEVGNQLLTITGVTAWGDQVSLEYLNGELVLIQVPVMQGTHRLSWRLSPADEARLFGS